MPEPIRTSEKPSLNAITKSLFEREVVEHLRTVHDPHIEINIYDLGLIYDVAVDDSRNVHILMTLTSAWCEYAQMLVGEAESMVRQVPDVGNVSVEVTFDPPWTMDRIDRDIRLAYGL